MKIHMNSKCSKSPINISGNTKNYEISEFQPEKVTSWSSESDLVVIK